MNPVAIKIGIIEIRWYAIFILIGFLLGIYLIIKESIKLGMDKNKIIDLCFSLILVSLIGARIYYVLFEFDQYKNSLLDIFKVWNGGLAIHGGIIAGIIYTYFYTKKNGLNILKITDIIVPSLILGQAIGRWGNFFNSEAYGPITTLSTLKSLHIPNFIIEGMYINVYGEYNYYHPTFLYESLWCLVGFIILVIVRKKANIRIGQLTGIYLILYGFERFFIESLRQDSLMFFGIKIAQAVSLVMFITGLILIIYSARKEKKYN